MKAERLMQMISALQGQGRMTADQLAAEFGVSVRTIYRDAQTLSELGVPIRADRGLNGGFELDRSYRSRFVGMTEDQAKAAFIGSSQFASALGLADASHQARQKVLSTMSPEMRESAKEVTQRLHVDPMGWYRSPEELTQLVTLNDALWQNRSIAIDYLNSPDLKVVGPLGLVVKAGIWYLVAETRQLSLKSFRVSRIRSARVLDQVFKRPADFDLAQYWENWVATFEHDRMSFRANLAVSPGILDKLPWILGESFNRSTRITRADGWTIFEAEFGSLEHATSQVLSLGGEVEVVGPDELTSAVKAAVSALSDRYSA